MNNCIRPPHFPPHCGCPAGAHDATKPITVTPQSEDK